MSKSRKGIPKNVLPRRNGQNGVLVLVGKVDSGEKSGVKKVVKPSATDPAVSAIREEIAKGER